MGQYTNKGLLNGYKKNNSEREADDYYATPPKEVYNILTRLGYDFNGKSILEPCSGGGHMIQGIEQYLKENNQIPKIRLATEYKDRGAVCANWNISYGVDFLDDDYPIESVDVIVMNPPYATLEPFLIRALEIAKNKLIVLCRTQALEGVGRFDKIFSINPPTDVYQYIDRIQCWRDGIECEGSSAQAYAWLVWDFDNVPEHTRLHWLHRAN